MKSLRDKRVLITGGARGIGLALARRFGADGAELILTDVDRDALKEARESLEARSIRCSTYAVDVTDFAAIARLREEIHGDSGPIHVLVNNAGVVFGGPFLDVPLERHLRTYRINVDGVVAMTHAFLPDLLAAEDAHLVNVASGSGFIALPWGTTYASSKWAVIGFSESLRQELAEQGQRRIGVTTVCPAYVATGMFEGVKPPLFTPFLTPDGLAAKVHGAILRDKAFVLEPWLVKLVPALMGLLPAWLSHRVAVALGLTSSMKTWAGHAALDRDASR